VKDFFSIIEVPDDADQSNEDMGTKYKFWYRHPELGRCLFKQARANTGEDWAEKLTAELAQKLNLPHVRYELASFKGQPGSISQSMLPQNAILQHGNEILASLAPSYPAAETYGVRQHTLDLVIQAISAPNVSPPFGWTLPLGLSSAIDTFIGYLMLDAWVSNSDRHHENWGFIVLENIFYLAPTYDHGSSLGRELLDTKRQSIFANGSVTNYIQNSRSALYRTVNDKKALLNLEVFQIAALRYPKTRLPPLARQFTDQILLQNQVRLLNIRESLS
jgi:hypothetical protein